MFWICHPRLLVDLRRVFTFHKGPKVQLWNWPLRKVYSVKNPCLLLPAHADWAACCKPLGYPNGLLLFTFGFSAHLLKRHSISAEVKSFIPITSPYCLSLPRNRGWPLLSVYVDQNTHVFPLTVSVVLCLTTYPLSSFENLLLACLSCFPVAVYICLSRSSGTIFILCHFRSRSRKYVFQTPTRPLPCFVDFCQVG